MNILLITADDLNRDSVGAFGCPTADTTPRLDALAAEGVRFAHGHVTIAVCQPSRSAIMTGRYPHRSGGEGFFHLRHPDVPTLPAILQAAGFRTGMLGKVTHSSPYAQFNWHMAYDQPALGVGRNPAVYAAHARDFMTAARRDGCPFFLMANSHDPHRPFFGNDNADWYAPRPNGQPSAVTPSRVFHPADVVTPGFLPDLPEVRREIAEYYSSVRRCDDTVGALLDALDASGAADDTLVLFLSDNGMAFPFAKTNCYLHSTATPLIARLPGAGRADHLDDTHFVSGIDFMPTILEAAGLPCPEGVDGRSFLPLLHGEPQTGRDCVFTQFHQTAGKGNYPMRCVQDRRYGYIFNPWSNGTRVFRNESQIGRTFAAMREAAADAPAIAARVDLFLHRVPEELYDFAADPDGHINRIADPEAREARDRLTTVLERWMEATDDPALETFRHRHDPAACEQLMQRTCDTIGGHA